MKWLILLFLTLVLVWSWQKESAEKNPRASQDQGESNSNDHHYYYSIPYAHTNKKSRFQASLPAKNWDGVYDAVREHVICLQQDGRGGVTGQEDCLVLNIYVAGSIHEKLLPVMVYIHGGGFSEGSSSPVTYGPDYLIDKGIILVTLNYRLYIQGFLCIGIKEAPGNAGLKDQVAALRWVKENIKAFGGDPDNVTLFGHSAGAASVSYHLLSPMSKGLFHKAILQSGSSISSWAIQYNPVYQASLLAKQMGYDTKDPVELYNIFMNKTNDELTLNKVPRSEGDTVISELLYAPCVEKEIPGVESFLTDSPISLLTRGEYNKVPLVIGWTNEEGLLFSLLENEKTLASMTVEKSLPRDLSFPSYAERKEYADKLTHLYLGDKNISKDNLHEVSKLHGVPYFEYPGVHESELILKTNDFPVFNYKFSYSGRMNLPWRSLGLPGATHADELMYLFKSQNLLLPQTPYSEEPMIDIMTTLWTNFAKFGFFRLGEVKLTICHRHAKKKQTLVDWDIVFSEPTPTTSERLPMKWNPTDRDNPEVCIIDQQFSSEPMWSSESLRIWKEIYTKYRRKHVNDFNHDLVL